MGKRIFKIIISIIITTLLLSSVVFAARLNPDIPVFDSVYMSLDSNGTATFVAPDYPLGWKRFHVQLLKRVTTVDAAQRVKYTYKTQGSVLYVNADDTEVSFTYSSMGYYQFQIRGEDLEGNYGPWMRMSGGEDYDSAYAGIAIGEEDISPGGGNNNVGTNNWGYGPGTVYISPNPQGYNNAVVGANGQILYYNNYYDPYYNPYAYNQGNYGPGFTDNNYNSQVYGPAGNQNYTYAPSPYNNVGSSINQNNNTQNGANIPSYNVGGTVTPPPTINSGSGTNQNTNPNNTTNPTQNTSPNTNPNSITTSEPTPNIGQGLEIGWHIDSRGRFYYQGNGNVLKGTWYLIDGNYYRFGNGGYLLTNQWFKDDQTGYWYYLAADGKMVTGWQKIGGIWYYFKPQNGSGYGTMYANTSILINDATYGSGYYAFDNNGAMVTNAWYGGHYYANDGQRTNN